MLQLLLSIAPWPWRRYEPERRIVASLYKALADVARAPGTPSTAPPLTSQISDAHDALTLSAAITAPKRSASSSV